MLTFKNRFVVNTALVNNASVSGAVGDLALGSAALGKLQNLPTAMIGGKMTTAQLSGAGQAGAGKAIVRLCGNAQVADPLAIDLKPIGWLGLLQGDSDAVVPLSSQFNGDLTYSIPTVGASQNTFPAIHSDGIASLGFGPTTILDKSSGAPAQVVNLLNTPVTNTVVFKAIP